MRRTPAAIIEATGQLLEGRDWQNGSIPFSVAEIVYPAMADCCAALRARGVPERAITKIMVPVGAMRPSLALGYGCRPYAGLGLWHK